MTTRLCLVLASSIQVEDTAYLRPTGVADPELRLRESIQALTLWMTRQSAIDRLVYVDNSGHRLDELRAVAEAHRATGKTVEFLSFRTADDAPGRGRSFGELDLLEKALGRSEFLSTAPHFAKVNARIFVPNMDRILRSTAPDFDVVGTLSHNLTWLDTVLVMFRKSLFAERILPGALAQVDDVKRLHIERVLARETLRCIADGARWYPFPFEPLLQGTRGLDGRPYPDGRLRARLMDLFGWGYHRARDNARGVREPHPMERWSRPRRS